MGMSSFVHRDRKQHVSRIIKNHPVAKAATVKKQKTEKELTVGAVAVLAAAAKKVTETRSAAAGV